MNFPLLTQRPPSSGEEYDEENEECHENARELHGECPVRGELRQRPQQPRVRHLNVLRCRHGLHTRPKPSQERERKKEKHVIGGTEMSVSIKGCRPSVVQGEAASEASLQPSQLTCFTQNDFHHHDKCLACPALCNEGGRAHVFVEPLGELLVVRHELSQPPKHIPQLHNVRLPGRAPR